MKIKKFKMKKTILILTVITTSFVQKLVAQDTTNLEEVTIYGDRIENPINKEGKSIQIITKEQLKNIPAQSINEVLVQFTGIDIRQRGANGVQADIGLRGSTFDQVLVLINGVKMNDPQTGHHTLNLPVDLASIERIEVVKGAGARVYGQNAFAGVVNIITKNPQETTLKFKLVGGDFNLGEISATATYATKKASHLLSVNHGFSDGYKFNTDYYLTNIFYSSQLNISEKDKIELMAGFNEKKFGANGFYSSPLFKDQYEETQTSIVSAKYKHKVGEESRINYGIYWRRNQDMYLFLRENPSYYRNHHIGNTVGININSVLKSKLGKTGLGIDVSRIFIESNNLGKRNRDLQTLFVEHQFSFFKNKITMTPGIQIVRNSEFGEFFLPGLDLNANITSYLVAFANAGKTFRTPTFTDLYYQGRTNIGNDLLQPEVALSGEVGFRFNKSGINIQTSYFYRNGKNIIDWTKNNTIDPWKPTNLLELNTKGFDVEFGINFAKLRKKTLRVSSDKSKASGFSFVKNIRIGYTNITSDIVEDTSFISKYAFENLANQVTSSITFAYFKNVTHSVLLRYSDRVNLIDYSILDTKLQYDNGKYLIYAEVSNLLDTKYQETNLVIMPGRWFRLGLGYTFK